MDLWFLYIPGLIHAMKEQFPIWDPAVRFYNLYRLNLYQKEFSAFFPEIIQHIHLQKDITQQTE